MKAFTWSATMHRLSLIDKLWYWWCGMRAPLSETTSREIKSLKWARLVPMRFETFHRAYAATHGLFWLPCPLCMREYGGHQAAGGVPDPMNPPAGPLSPLMYVGICPPCTRLRKGAPGC